MKWISAVAGLLGALGVAAAGLGWVIARRVTAPVTGRRFDLVVRDVVEHDGEVGVVLDRTAQTEASGIYNLWLDNGGWVHLGEVASSSGALVTRRVDSVRPPGSLQPGVHASWSGVYFRDPADAGLDAEDVLVNTPVGPAPAWLIRSPHGESDRCAIHVHGMGSARAGTLRGVRVAAQSGLTSLVVTYRNDGEGPTVGSGRSTLGATETKDVAAAVRFAIDHGARRVVLFGWSMGAAIALQLAADEEFRGVIESLVLDSPVLDWQATINANCARVGLPASVGWFARPWIASPPLAFLMGLDSAVPLNRFDWIRCARKLQVPATLLHAARDTSAPFASAEILSTTRTDLVRLDVFDADHAMCWNAAGSLWEFRVGDVLRL